MHRDVHRLTLPDSLDKDNPMQSLRLVFSKAQNPDPTLEQAR